MITSIALVVLMIVHLISWVVYQKHQFLERDLVHSDPETAYQKHNKGWHFWKGINHISVYGMLYFGFGFKWMMIFAVLFWAGFDILVNVVVLKRKALHVGKTADTDLFIRKVSNIIKISPEHTSLLIKVAILLGVIVVL